MARHLIPLGVALLLTAGAAGAETLPDPTRPPPGFGGEAAGGEAADAAPRLQSVVIPKNGRPTAVISGRTVRLGDKVGEGRLKRLTETEAVIAGPGGIERLQLTPDVEKTPVAPALRKSPAKTKEKP